MIYLKVAEEDLRYHMWEVVRLFYEEEEVKVVQNEPPEGFRGIFVSGTLDNSKGQVFHIQIRGDGHHWMGDFSLAEEDAGDEEKRKQFKWTWKRALYIQLEKIHQRKLPWGMLTGIRPAKIVQEMLENGRTRQEILGELVDYYFVSESKAELLYDVARAEKKVLDESQDNSIALYIGIPFCPTRCLYCSFTSNPIDKCKNLVNGYLNALKHEIIGVRQIIEEKRLKIESIYMGGGTPTSLHAEQLRDLLQFIECNFDLGSLKEYTLEAGRPDSINRDKLNAIKESRADRISINPQTMNDQTLRAIGRSHTAGDIVEAFKLARETGFNNINMDIIVGLPGETLEMFLKTLQEIESLDPENLTVHTMAVKRASKLMEEKEQHHLIPPQEAAEMVDRAREFARRMGMHPYYLYRQKNMLGKLENVGYCKPGFESVYNVQIMEERQTVIALGAGAITKVVYPAENRIERAFNVKNVEQYISRVDEMLERKRALLY